MVVQAFVVTHRKLLIGYRKQGLRQDFKVGLKGTSWRTRDRFGFIGKLSGQKMLRWSLVKWVLWLIKYFHMAN